MHDRHDKKITVRIDEEMHRTLEVRARESGKSVNDFISQIIKDRAEQCPDFNLVGAIDSLAQGQAVILEAIEMLSRQMPPGRTDGKRRPQKVDISCWFDSDKLLAAMGDMINTALPGDWQWSAVHLGQHVFVKPSALWAAIVRAGWPPIIKEPVVSEQYCSDIMYSVVDELSIRPDTIATEFLGEGYYGAMFMFASRKPGERVRREFLVPFRASAFKSDILEMAQRRALPAIRDIKSLWPLVGYAGRPVWQSDGGKKHEDI